MGDQDHVAAVEPLDPKSLRLLRHLALVGLLEVDRLPARERLAAELRNSPACAALLPEVESAAVQDSAGPGRAA